jgi:hypothetical protein
MKNYKEIIDKFGKQDRLIQIEGGRFANRELEQAISIFQKIRDNELPILYLAVGNSAFIVNANEYQKEKEKLKLYERLYTVCKEYKETSIALSDDSEFINIMKELEIGK